jgi:hypothetical protein
MHHRAAHSWGNDLLLTFSLVDLVPLLKHVAPAAEPTQSREGKKQM